MILNVQNLSIRYPVGRAVRTLIRNVSFHVARGEILGVVGESGCGKSITNLAIMGLLPPGAQLTADRFELRGRDLTTASARDWLAIRGRIAAMIFQNPLSALNPSMTVGAQLGESISKAGPRDSRRQRESRALELLNQVGISSARLRLKSYPHQLSGGMAQRVMIAMALASRPAMLIADEPTTGLDATIQAQILDLLLEIRRDTGMAIVFVSHDIGVVRACADRIHVMYSGEIVETGPARRVTDCPAHPYTEGLMRSLPGRVETPPKTRLPVIPGSVLPIGMPMEGCRFAPRCGRAQTVCRIQPPLTTRVEGDASSVRCHF